MTTVVGPDRGIRAARAVVRIAGAGHSAAIHSEDPRVITDYAAQVPVLRVSVNVGNSTGSSGLDTNLAPSMTIGTGFVGRSSIGENLQPHHLVNHTRIAYNADAGVVMPSFGHLPWRAPAGPVPAYPWLPTTLAPCRNRSVATPVRPVPGPTIRGSRRCEPNCARWSSKNSLN